MNRKIFLKVLFLGEGGVGKTSLIKRFFYKRFSEPTITRGFEIYTLNMDNVSIIFWDVGGQERFRHLTNSKIINGAPIGVLVFDSSRPNTFKKILEYWAENKYVKKIPIKILVANKIDLGFIQDRSVIDDFIEKYGIRKFFITSAKNGQGVDELFDYILSIINSILKIFKY